MTYEVDDKRNIKTAEREWDSSIDFAPTSNTNNLVETLLEPLETFDDEVKSVYDEQHINTATGRHLEKIGDLVNVTRQSNETDATLRARIKAKFRSATTATTFDEFTEFVAAVLESNIENFEFVTEYRSTPTVQVYASPQVYDAVDLTTTEISPILGSGVPAGHEVQVLEGGTFRLKSDTQDFDPERGLTSDSYDNGGTLATELIE